MAGSAYRARQATPRRTHALTRRFLENNLPLVCPALGCVLEIGLEVGQGGGWRAPTVDRIDNRKGYTADNVVVVCKRANSIKGNKTPAEILVLAEAARRGELKGDHARVFLFFAEILQASVRLVA